MNHDEEEEKVPMDLSIATPLHPARLIVAGSVPRPVRRAYGCREAELLTSIPLV